jgi:glycosyltransferase involved in cell wall biosynthesis
VKVRFDDQIFCLQSRGGISRYFVELMRAFGSDPAYGVELEARAMWTANHHLLDAGMGRRVPSRWGQRRRLLKAANRAHWSRWTPRMIHHTYYDASYLRPIEPDGLRAVTIYDMIPEIYPELFPDGNPHLDKKAFVEAADLIFCISAATKGDLVEVYGQPNAPIVVTPLGVDARFSPSAVKPARLPAKYILFVGKRGGYKDFAVLVQAFADCNFSADVKLVAVGGGPFGHDEVKALEALGLAERVCTTGLSDNELAGAYAHALCFVFPSRHEGFGLPTLEAMASGCPTLLASSSSHTEVGGDAALYFSPGDTADLSRLLRDLVANPELRADRRAAGLVRAAVFTWQTTARRTAAAYRHLGASKA